MVPTATPVVGHPQRVAVRRERDENFPVALRVLPRDVRSRLHAAYLLARRIDDLGDDPARTPAQRLADLDAFAVSLPSSAASAGLPVQPFADLIEANRVDQRVSRIATYADLLDYCRLSANPIGRVVLAVFRVSDAEADRLSDDVCTALQILEHCQDVGEDLRDRDRVYLPLADLTAFGVTVGDLRGSTTPRAVRALAVFEAERARELLASGPLLVRRLRGWARVAIAGYVAGGLATADALVRCDGDVLAPDASRRKPRRRDVARHALRLLAARR